MKRQWTGRVFIGRDAGGKQQFHWLGRFATKRERDAAVARARTERPWLSSTPEAMTCDELADRYLGRYAARNKASSTDTARQSLVAFREAYGARGVASLTPVEAEDWARTMPPNSVLRARAALEYACGLGLLSTNPLADVGPARGRGRADQHPPTEHELDALRLACVPALGLEYGPRIRDLLDFAALTLMRPGELYELRWTDIDLAHNRITVERRLYRGLVDTPKSGHSKTIALVPPARDILLRQPTRAGELVFVSRTGARLSAPVLSQDWGRVRAAAGCTREMPFYLASKHYGVHELYKLGLSPRAIAAQAGWSEKSVDAMLRVYGHGDIAALDEVDALYEAQPEGVKT